MLPHESAKYHVTGEAVYIDDMPTTDQLLYGRVVYSPHAHAKIISFDIEAAKKLEGVHAVLCYKDIPGHNDMGPVFQDEPVLAKDVVHCVGQAIFLIASESETIALQAEKLIKINYEILEPILSIEQAIQKNNKLQPSRKIECGNIEKGFKLAKHFIEGELKTGAQEHWYLETQTCLCIPGEGNEIKAYSSTQHPSETQALIAEVLGIPKAEVEVQTRRMGGAFGGKETQANHTAIWAALLCKATNRPVKIRLFRDDDQKITGKRHPFLFQYKVGFDEEGLITAIDVEEHTDGGCATDLSMAILERAMMHSDNAYFIPNMRIIGHAWKTNLPSNTAFRGFGGPQGVAFIEAVMDRIARFLKKDAADIRFKNFYGLSDRNTTPYGQKVEHNRLYVLWDKLIQSSEYIKRRKELNEYNAQNEFYKRGLALTPVKFGISFTTSFLNQAGALVNIYKDGSVLVNHGGTEMGQGLHTKIQLIAAHEFGLKPDRIKVNATNTSKVPNTSATAASSGTDLNGQAVKNAIDILKKRIIPVVGNEFRKKYDGEKTTRDEHIRFENNFIFDNEHPDRKMKFEDAISMAYLQQVSLSSTGFYKTPDIYFDREKGKGKPYHYFAFGMAVTEVLLDTLTGHHEILRTDILHDVGDSINTRLDIGQIEGAFIQGLGWCTTEECKWDTKGNLLNHSPDTYKIPSINDIPNDFRVQLLKGVPNHNTIRKSKAIGEPPFMLALSCWLAIKDAISAISNHEVEPKFSLPATNEAILLSVENLKTEISSSLIS